MIIEIQSATDQAWDIAINIGNDGGVKNVIDGNVEVNFRQHQVKACSAPIISNAIFARDKKIIENEKWKTIYALAKHLDRESFKNVVNELNLEVVERKTDEK